MTFTRSILPALTVAGFVAVAAQPAAAHPGHGGVTYDPAYNHGGYIQPAGPAYHGYHQPADWPGPVLSYPPEFTQKVVKVPHTTTQPVTRVVYRPVAQAGTRTVYETVMVNGVPTTVTRQVPDTTYQTVPVTVTEEVEVTTYTPANAVSYDVPESLTAQYGDTIFGQISQRMPLYAGSGAPIYGFLYVVKRGDTLSSIAKRFYADPKGSNAIFGVNHPNILSPHEIKTGQVIIVPTN